MTWERADGTFRLTSAYTELNILAHAEMYEITLSQACGGQAECGTCRVHVLSGSVTQAMGEEIELRNDHPTHFAENERLSCRTRPLGDLTIRLRGRRPADLRDVDD
jgi:ferredoxin